VCGEVGAEENNASSGAQCRFVLAVHPHNEGTHFMARILVIDDDASLLQMVRLMLEREGHEVLLAEGGEEGLNVAFTQSPDLAVIDLMMPGMSGYSVTRALRADPRTQNLPILILTARGQPMDRQMALDAGANAHMTKPVTSKELMARINEVTSVSTGAPSQPAEATSELPMTSAAPAPATDHPSRPRRPIGLTQELLRSSLSKAAPSPEPVIPTARLPVLTVIALRGGSGTTTVAINLALLLNERHGQVCLVDLTMAGGHIGLHLHMAARQSWADLMEAGDALDSRLIGSILAPHPGLGLSVMAAPPVPGTDSLSQPAMESVLTTLTGTFGQVVVDADTLTPASISALLASYAIVVVMSDDVMSVHTTSNFMQTLQRLGVEMGRVRVAVNHSRPDPGVPSATILKALGRPISAEIPYDPNQMQAIRRGIPLAASAPDSAFTKALQQLIKTF
jgi:DNA-binding response OmpR family regulator/MinD-like ATPase involved in chromosome partitioning or flagellar assembly